MSSDLLSIGKSGAMAARAALDVTAQNIANASTDGYIRRSVSLSEVASAGGYGRIGDISVSGVRVNGVVRNADLFRQSEVRRTGSDSARAAGELNGLENTESAVEQSGVYDAMVKFEGSLNQLVGDPTSTSLRSSVVENARSLASTFNVASKALDSVGTGLRFEATDGVTQVNTLAQQLGSVNLRLARAADATSDQTALLDQRDSLLQQISAYTDVTTTFAADNTVTLAIGGTPGQTLVQGGTVQTLAMATAANGTISFSVNGTATTLAGGSLAGKALALTKLDSVHTGLDTIAASLASTVNSAQAAGVDLNGATGQPLFAGTTAATLSLALTNGTGIATAPAGAPANSRDASNLTAMQTALGTADPAGKTDALIFDISSTVAGRKITSDALKTIADTAKVNLAAQAGVSLDNEAVNLVRYQQAFQASGKVMQAAKDIFDTLLAIR